MNRNIKMKINYLLMLLICGVCFSCNEQQQDKQEAVSTKENKDMTKEELREKLVMAMGFDTERTIGVYPGSSWTIVDTEDVLGVNLNIKPKR